MEELQAISDAWLQGKNVREKGFSLGRFSPESVSYTHLDVYKRQAQ